MPFRSLMRSVLRLLPVRITIRLHDAARAVRLRRHLRRPDPRPIALIATHELSASGAPRVAYDVARVLFDRGYRLIVVTQEDGSLRRDFEELGALIVIDLVPSRDQAYLHHLAQRAKIAFANTVISAPLVRAWAPHVPTCWYFHELSAFETQAASGALAVPLADAARVWAGSELCAKLVRPYRDDVVVLPYGLAPISQTRKSTPAGDTDKLQVAVLGSIEPRKGQDLALDGLEMLDVAEREKLHLRLYGRQLNSGFSRQILQRCATTPTASFGGALDHAGYRAALAGSDCILICSREDTAPLVSIDALSAERMLLLTRAVGTSAWLNDGVDALIEDRADAAAMARLFRRALAARPQAVAMGTAARARFDAVFSLAAFKTRLVAEFDTATSLWLAQRKAQ